jgi:hypothetical protein
MTAFWYVIVTLGIITAAVNFGIAFARRKQQMVALVRGLAGVVSLVPPVGIVVGKALAIPHPSLAAQDVFVATGVFIFAVLLLPSYFERTSANDAAKPTMQQRAARPVNATIRLRDASSDEWVN